MEEPNNTVFYLQSKTNLSKHHLFERSPEPSRAKMCLRELLPRMTPSTRSSQSHRERVFFSVKNCPEGKLFPHIGSWAAV